MGKCKQDCEPFIINVNTAEKQISARKKSSNKKFVSKKPNEWEKLRRGLECNITFVFWISGEKIWNLLMPTRIWRRLREMFYWKRGFSGKKSKLRACSCVNEIFFKSSTLPPLPAKTSKRLQIEEGRNWKFFLFALLPLIAHLVRRRKSLSCDDEKRERRVKAMRNLFPNAKTRKCFNSRRSDKPRARREKMPQKSANGCWVRSVESSWNFREVGAPHFDGGRNWRFRAR